MHMEIKPLSIALKGNTCGSACKAQNSPDLQSTGRQTMQPVTPEQVGACRQALLRPLKARLWFGGLFDTCR